MGKPHILVVDEHAEIAQLECALFSMRGYNVDVVVDADAGLRKALLARHDVIVLGAPLFVFDGGTRCSFLDALCRHRPGIARATIVVTADVSNAELLARCAAADVYAIISKPFEVDLLTRTVDECVSPTRSDGPTRWLGVAQTTP
jgi:CheY-like chemotaxis protein